MKKEAMFWTSLPSGQIQCQLCPHYCVLREGQLGRCGTRRHDDNKLWTLIYGECSAIAADPIEKKPLKRFYPGTQVLSVGSIGCNLSCAHCQNWQISTTSTPGRSTTFLSPLNLVDLAKKRDCQGVAFTYNEPTIWHEFTYDAAARAKENGLYTVYVTNGFINPPPLEHIMPYLDAFSLDIKGYSSRFFKEICGIEQSRPIFEAAKLIKNKWQKHLEIVTNIIPGHNDQQQDFLNLANWIRTELGADTPWHLTRFYPQHKLNNIPPTPLDTLNALKDLALKQGLSDIILGNV